MIRSMTGFGKASIGLPDNLVTIEIKSLNSKQLDLSIRLPVPYRDKEPEIRNMVSQQLGRGKIDLGMFTEATGEEGLPVINQEVVKNYYRQLKKIAGELQISEEEPLLPIILRFPDTLKTEKKIPEEEEWGTIRTGIQSALDEVNRFREQEGKALEKEMRDRTLQILALLGKVDELEKDRMKRMEERLRGNVREFLNAEGFDPARFEQELIYYLEKMDISEEKVRLRNHCNYFLETTGTLEAAGKKLGFITQEMGREINTLGSKANDAGIQKLVVQMKDELEKIREQVWNVL